MIDNDVDKADGELRTMLAGMVNAPVIDAVRKNGDALANLMSESMKAESSLILRQSKEIANSVKELSDDLDTLRSKVDQVLKGNDSLKTTGIATKAELERSVTEIVSRLDLIEGAERASHAALQEIVAQLLRSEKDRADNKVVWIKALQGLRLQVALWGVLSVLEAIGIAALLFHSFGH